jgi:hypothetical protein
MLSDLRLALRRLRRQRGFALLTIAVVALGVGAATAMFSMVNALVLRPLPYPGADRLVHVQRNGAGRTSACSREMFRELQARSTVFEGLAGFGWGDRARLARAGEAAEMLWTLRGTVGFFQLLGATATAGRLFSAEEDRPGGARVAVLSDRLWRTRFAADPSLVGRQLQLDGEAVTVIGVMAAGFTDPTLYWSRVDIFRPLALPPPSPADRADGVQVFARLRPGVSRAAAQAELDAIAAGLPDARRSQTGLVMRPLRETSGLNVTSRRVVWLTLGLAGFVLLIACINYDRLQQRLTAIPGVQQVSMSWWLPLENFSTRAVRDTFRTEEQPAPTPATATLAHVNAITPEYLATLGIAVREGRGFRADDGPQALPVALVSEGLARRLWPGQSPLGKRIGRAEGAPGWRTIVGVVGDVGFAGSLAPPSTPFHVYRPLAQNLTGGVAVTLRSQRRPEELTTELGRAVAAVDPDVMVWEALPARDLMSRSLANFEMTAWVVAAFAAIGVLLAALGVYGLFAAFVVDRRREIGVRLALGARTAQVLWLVLRQGLRLVLAGALLGLAGAAATTRLLAAITPGLPVQHPAVVLALAMLLIAVAAFACWLPARRAAAVDPMVVLQQE